MSSKTKNILRNIGFLISIPVIIGAFVFAVSEDQRSHVKAIQVDIVNSNHGFVTKQDIINTLTASNVEIDYSAIELLDLTALEEKINANPWVEQAEVYVSSTQCIKVRLKQMEPKLRVQRADSTANGYYLDQKGYMMPLSRIYSPDVPILTSERSITSIDQRRELVKLAQFIQQDTFWNATISQINLDKNNDIELISLIGDANIRFGSTQDMEDKFFRLFQFYKKGINRINWANVKELDLRFDKQLVCRRYHKEQLIEEQRVPMLYVKQASQTSPTEHQQALASTTHAAVPQIEREESQPAIEQPEQPKNEQVTAAAVGKESAVTKEPQTEKKVEQAELEVVKKTTPMPEEQKEVRKEEAIPVAPKPKKKKREIIINTEPVTKNETQK